MFNQFILLLSSTLQFSKKKGETKSYLDQEPVSRSPAKAFKPWLGLDTNHAFRYPVERTYFRALGPQLFERQLALTRG